MIAVSERHCWLRRMLGRQLVSYIACAFESQCCISASCFLVARTCKVMDVPLCSTKPRACFESSTSNVQPALPRTIANKLHDNPVANLILT